MTDHSIAPRAVDLPASTPALAGTSTDSRSHVGEPPVYKKPRLRRYDQIEQVKPYGPSERKAG